MTVVKSKRNAIYQNPLMRKTRTFKSTRFPLISTPNEDGAATNSLKVNEATRLSSFQNGPFSADTHTHTPSVSRANNARCPLQIRGPVVSSQKPLVAKM